MKFKNPFAKTLSGSLICGRCRSNKLEYVESTAPDERRYKCKNCGCYIRYQYRYKPLENDNKPYASHKRGLDLERARKIFGKQVNIT